MTHIPQISRELVLFLEQRFTPVTDTRGVDIRDIDFRSGQYSVVTTLKALAERQVSNGRISSQGSE